MNHLIAVFILAVLTVTGLAASPASAQTCESIFGAKAVEAQADLILAISELNAKTQSASPSLISEMQALFSQRVSDLQDRNFRVPDISLVDRKLNTYLSSTAIRAVKKIVAELPARYRNSSQIKFFVESIARQSPLTDPTSLAIFFWLTRPVVLQALDARQRILEIVASEGLEVRNYQSRLETLVDRAFGRGDMLELNELRFALEGLRAYGIRRPEKFEERHWKNHVYGSGTAVQNFLAKKTIGRELLQTLLAGASIRPIHGTISGKALWFESNLVSNLVLDNNFINAVRENLANSEPATIFEENTASNSTLRRFYLNPARFALGSKLPAAGNIAEVTAMHVLYFARSTSQMKDSPDKQILMKPILEALTLVNAWNPRFAIGTKADPGSGEHLPAAPIEFTMTAARLIQILNLNSAP